MLKRFSAFLLDLILVCVIGAGFALLISYITGMDGYVATLQNYYTEYGEKYDVDFNISSDDYEELSEEEKQHYDEVYKQIFIENDDAYTAYQMTTNLPLLIVSVALLLAFLIYEFVIPIFLKNGQTVGKKVFSLGVVFTNGVRITMFALFVRNILGKYTVETMVPIALFMMMFWYNVMGIVGFIVIALLLLFELGLLIGTKTNSFIHDIVSNTVVVDMQSQMIFDSEAELIACKEAAHAEEVKKTDNY